MHDISNRKSRFGHSWNLVVFPLDKFVGKVVGDLEHEKKRLLENTVWFTHIISSFEQALLDILESSVVD